MTKEMMIKDLTNTFMIVKNQIIDYKLIQKELQNQNIKLVEFIGTPMINEQVKSLVNGECKHYTKSKIAGIMEALEAQMIRLGEKIVLGLEAL